MNTIGFEHCDFCNPVHLSALANLLNHYMSDPMGGVPPLNKTDQLRMVDGLASHPSALVLFIFFDEKIAGVATCYINFSTFKAKPYLYIHDIVIYQEYRRKGLGRVLMEKLISLSKEREYCKITLEVREDNVYAQALYSNLGFKDCEPRMLFWAKNL